MTARTLALWMVIFAFACLGMAFLTSCAGGAFSTPQLCIKTDYGTFCYQPEFTRTLKDK